jgi:hypothetical protein
MRSGQVIVGTAVLLATFAFTAPAASARGDGWQYAGNPGDFQVSCPSGPLDVHTLAANEYFRTSTLSDGTTLIQVTGSLLFEITNPANGESTFVNASGPAVGPWRQQARPNGDFLFSSAGLNFIFGVPGFPDVSVTSGPVAILFTAQGEFIIERLPPYIEDICALLGAE